MRSARDELLLEAAHRLVRRGTGSYAPDERRLIIEAAKCVTDTNATWHGGRSQTQGDDQLLIEAGKLAARGGDPSWHGPGYSRENQVVIEAGKLLARGDGGRWYGR
jgi:hypothetical protein